MGMSNKRIGSVSTKGDNTQLMSKPGSNLVLHLLHLYKGTSTRDSKMLHSGRKTIYIYLRELPPSPLQLSCHVKSKNSGEIAQAVFPVLRPEDLAHGVRANAHPKPDMS